MTTTDDATTQRLRAFFGSEGEPTLAPPGRIGRWKVVRELGRGGMGVVYEAHDPELGRHVAIKVLKDGPGDRLRAEATAAARLRHPNVITVFEIGPDYIVMELVDGPTLAQAAPGMSGEQRLEALEQVARAVGYAHEQGVVHRDLKPDNVLVGQDGRAVLGDFGLAKLGDETFTTMAGAGTPHYMAPEQVRGDRERMGPRSDIWALGVMLFEALEGKLPFTGASEQTVYQAITTGPVPEATGPLAPVVARALQRDPARRYGSATELAEELARHRQGMPLQTRATSTFGRLRAFLHVRRVAAIALLAAVGTLVLVGTLTFAERRARARVLEALRDQARLSLKAALELRRAGALGRMREFEPPLRAAYEQALARAPDQAELEYLMGRLHRALLDHPRALAFQDRALAKDPQFPPALFERALLLTLEAIRQQHDDDPPPMRDERAVEAWDRYFRAATKRSAPATLDDALAPAMAKGLAALAQGHHRNARRALQQAVAIDPQVEEGWEALAKVGMVQRQQGEAAAERLFRERDELLTAMMARDQGYVPHLLERAKLRLDEASRRRRHGRDPLPGLALAAEDFERATQLAPEHPVAWSGRGRVALYRAIWKLETSADPEPDLVTAETHLDRAVRLDDRSVPARLWRANVRFYRGVARAGRETGRGALPFFEAAEQDHAVAARIAPERTDVWRWRGRNLAHLAAVRAAMQPQDEDPGALFAPALACFARGEALRDRTPWLRTWWGSALRERARWRGGQAQADLVAAERHLDDAVAKDGELPESLRERGLVRLARARLLVQTQGSERELRTLFAQASTDLMHATGLDPRLREPLSAELREARRGATAPR